MRRLFDANREAGITRFFEYDDLTGEATITTEQDVTAVVEEAKRKNRGFTSLDRWGDGRLVAHVPMSVYSQWVVEGKDKDSAFIRRWLNDPDNKHLRVFPGRV